MNPILTLAALFLLALLALLAWQGYRILAGTDRMRLPDMARALGKTIRAPLSETEARKAGEAGRRCMACPSHERCDHWLEDGKGAPGFCPNISYIERLPQAHRPPA